MTDNEKKIMKAKIIEEVKEITQEMANRNASRVYTLDSEFLNTHSDGKIIAKFGKQRYERGSDKKMSELRRPDNRKGGIVPATGEVEIEMDSVVSEVADKFDMHVQDIWYALQDTRWNKIHVYRTPDRGHVSYYLSKSRDHEKSEKVS